jgi:hypothetical protein
MSSSFRSPVPGKGARLSYFVPGPVAVAAKGISHGNARKGMDDKNSAKPEPILLRILKFSVCFRVIPWPSLGWFQEEKQPGSNICAWPFCQYERRSA